MLSPLPRLFRGRFLDMFVLRFISGVVSKILQSLEYFRSGFGRYFVMLVQNVFISKILLVPIVIFAAIRMAVALFSRLCSAISGYLSSMNFNGIVVGGVDVLALANSVLPLDETMGLVVIWFTVYSVCATIRFVRAAWAAIPLKAT